MPDEPEFRSSEVYEVEGEILEIDRTLTELIRSGLPAVVTGCRHEPQVLKQGRLFMVAERDGGIYGGCKCGMGLYREDTRFLSGLTFRLEDQAPTLLSGSTERINTGHIQFMNPPLDLSDGTHVRQETLQISVVRAIADTFREQIKLINFNAMPLTLRLTLAFYSDFADIFEVRGLHRQGHGIFFRPKLTDSSLTLRYRGGDELLRQTRVSFAQPPVRLEPTPYEHASVGASATWELTVPPNGGEALLEYEIETLEGKADSRPPEPFPVFLREVERLIDPGAVFPTHVHTDNAVFNLVWNRSVRDMVALTSQYPTGPFIAAGIPWFTCPFGRDALTTALQTLMLGPDLARGVLRFLAAHQGKQEDPFRDEQPGKILHELRYGELARLRVIPHTPYYGTVDATPLWLILLSETYRWTGDASLVHELWDNVEAALLWLETYGDMDGDGFVEYHCESTKGIRNQGWKDAFNSVIFPDGRLAESPIALAEVQGYVYDAKHRAAELCRVVGQELLARRLIREADELKDAYNETFWSEELGYYAMALDREKKPVWTRTSNPGYGLWSGILDRDRHARVVEALLSPGMFSGWGIRTLAADSPVYNPIGYHNGTVWPHDNSILAKGMADRGFKQEALRIFDAMFDTAVRFPYYRLPELFCGFERQGELDAPIPYPVACSPQAWAAATPIWLLQAVLGLHADAAHQTLKVSVPTLPAWLGRVTVTGLRVGAASIDLEFIQIEGATTTRIRNKVGDLTVLIEG